MAEPGESGSPSGHPKRDATKLVQLNVDQKIERVEGGEINGIKIGQVVIQFHLAWLALAVLLLSLGYAAIQFYPRIAGPGPIKGDFRIAVAQFGQADEQGRITASQDATDLSDSIFSHLANEVSGMPKFNQFVGLRYLQGTIIRDQQAAAAAAQKTHAQLIIYGNLQVHGTARTFVPQFLVTELVGAEELVGASELGQPVSVVHLMPTVDALQARSQALSLFAMGLGYFDVGQYDTAIDYFNKAIGQMSGNDRAGTEVLYLFLGSAYKGRGTANKSASDMALAGAAYRNALGINPQYARAYIGLGNTYYEEYRWQPHADAGQASASLLDLARTNYISATLAADKPATAYVDAKLNYSLGNIYNAQAQAGQTALFEAAQQEFDKVIAQYDGDRNNAQLKAIAAYAYCGLGVVEERGRHEYGQAAGFYQQCLDMADNDQSLRDIAARQLKAVQNTAGTPPR